MNGYELAKHRNEKRLARLARYAEKAPEKKEEKVEPKPAPRDTPKPMTLLISGPVEMVLEVDYQGTLISSQVNEKNLRELFAKCLKPIGRVR